MIVGDWRAARVADVSAATSTARVLRLTVPGWPGSEPGQHVDIRLTAEDGYQAVRSYSLGSYGASPTIELAVDEIPEGEVSPYLVRDVQPGDELEVKGPLGGYFVWRPGGVRQRAGGLGRSPIVEPEPVQLIAGGSGIVPLMAMARARRDAAGGVPFRLLYSVRGPENAIYRDELLGFDGSGGVDVTWAYTRAAPPGWDGRVGRLDASALAELVWAPDRMPAIYVCGPTGFVEHVADTLTALGHDAGSIRTERFGGA